MSSKDEKENDNEKENENEKEMKMKMKMRIKAFCYSIQKKLVINYLENTVKVEILTVL